jgi:hypothetical protein
VSQPFEVQLESAYERKVLFALELLDAVTLARVSRGVKKVKAEGLHGEAIVNGSGHFVWLNEDISALEKITLDLGVLPYEPVEIPAANVRRPLTTIELQPRLDYPFTVGITGIRGTLIEDADADPKVPVAKAVVGLRWLDEDAVTWHDSPTTSKTSAKGDFVSILRLSPTDAPDIDADRKLTVRLRVRRDTNERNSADIKLPQGRVADPSTISALTFAWDELQP